MGQFLDKWEPGHFLALAGIIFGAIVLMVALALRRSVRLAQIAAQLKLEMIRKELSVDDIERLLRAPAAPPPPPESDVSDEEAVGEVAGMLAAQGATGIDIEQVMAMLSTADPATRQAVYRMCSSMAENDATADQMIAAARGLCRKSVKQEEPRSVMADL